MLPREREANASFLFLGRLVAMSVSNSIRGSRLIIPLFLWLCANAALAVDEIGPLPEKYEESADWVLSLTSKPMNDYLKFPKSPVSPLTNVEVSYKVRNSEGAWGKTRSYETLWYHDGKPKGLRRHEKLQLGEDTHGVIRIKRSGDTSQQMKALTNAVLRLLPDVYLQNATLNVAMYPRDLCDQADMELSTMRFYRVKKTTGDIQTLTLHVVSDTEGFDRYYYYSAVRKGQVLE